MEENQDLVTANFPAVFLPKISEDAFAAVIFIAPRSQKWKMVWSLCQKTQHLEENKNYLALFDSSSESITILAQILHEAYAWKSAYLFIRSRLVDKSDASQWLRCFLLSEEHDDPIKTFCLRENDYYHFKNQLTNTARSDQTASFITPCICAAAFARFSDQVEASFKEQFDYYARKRFAHLCPNYRLDNFSGPFVREGAGLPELTIKVRLEYEESQDGEYREEKSETRVERSRQDTRQLALEKGKKKKMSLWKKIAIAVLVLAVLGALAGKGKEEKTPEVTSGGSSQQSNK